MPRAKRAKQSASKGRTLASVRRQKGGAAHAAAIPYASSSGLRTKFEVNSLRVGGSQCLRVRMIDQLTSLNDPTVQSSTKPLIADRILFTLDHRSEEIAKLGELLPKLQGLASISSRYQVRSARVHFQSTSAASTPGYIGIALAPGVVPVPSAVEELASFDHSLVVPVWQSSSTSLWRNSEQRYYHTDTGAAPTELPPFTILRAFQKTVAASSVPAVGLVWLELEIDFLDLRPMPQASASFRKSEAQTFLGGGTANTQVVRWAEATAMDGLWEWGKDRVVSVFDGVNLFDTIGSTVAADGDQLIEWFGDFVLGAASSEAKASLPLLTWSEDDEKSPERVVVPRPRVFPGPWKQPPRYREICCFSSLSEARAAARAGFSPHLVAAAEPQAAGDFAIWLNFMPLGGGGTPLAYWTVSGGTGAQEVKTQWSGEIDQPGVFYTAIAPTGTETRTLDPTSSMDLSVVGRLTSQAP